MDRFKNKYQIASARLSDWDYGSHGLYFVTICTLNRMCYFGDITEKPSVETQYFASPPFAHEKSENHLSGGDETQNTGNEMQNIASLQCTEIGGIANQYWKEIPEHFPFVELDEYVVMPNHVHGILFINKPEQDQWQPNKFGPQSQNLVSVIRGFKAGVKKHATLHQIVFAWQPRYYDRVIRSEKELQNIRQYIFNNPAKWETEKNNPENLLM